MKVKFGSTNTANIVQSTVFVFKNMFVGYALKSVIWAIYKNSLWYH